MYACSSLCKHCREPTLVFDTASCAYVCSSCGLEHHSDVFQSHLDGAFGEPQGTFVRVGSTPNISYRERKLFLAETLITHVASSLGLSPHLSSDLRHMVDLITDSEFGSGSWFSILIAACAHIISRQSRHPLPIPEIAAATGSDPLDITRMVIRVTQFLDIQVPQFDFVAAFEHAIQSSHSFSIIPSDKSDQILTQGRFLLQCCIKWFLTTGRRPMPIIAAVSTFVAKVNGLSIRIEDVAKEMHAVVSTSKLRYKELTETLIKVARALPWGKDVTEKNLVKNAPLILKYMMIKLKQEPKNSSRMDLTEQIGRDLQEMAGECTSRVDEYEADGYLAKNVSQYFNIEDGDRMASHDDLERLKLSKDCMCNSYVGFLNGFSSAKSMTGGELTPGRRRKRNRGGLILSCRDWWVENLDLGKRLPLDQVLERDIGFDAFPPSFVAGIEACKRRKEKIISAKLRIQEIMHPTAAGAGGKAEVSVSTMEDLEARKEWNQRRQGHRIDPEDCIIELLLLHGVKEDKIEQGHYNTLLDLHVFYDLGSERLTFQR